MNVSNTTSLTNNSLNLNSNIANLSSASKVNSAAEDASSMMIANAMSSEVRGLGQAVQNTNDAIGMVQVASGAMQEYGNILNDVRDLTVRSSNGIMNSSNLAIVQKEIDGLMSSANDILDTTSYNGNNLFQGSSNFSVQTGTEGSDSIGIDFGNALVPNIDILSASARQESLNSIDSAIESAGSIMSSLGSSQNALVAHANSLSVYQVNTAESASQLGDVDFAKESADFNKNNLLDQAGVFALAQKNITQANAISLLN